MGRSAQVASRDAIIAIQAAEIKRLNHEIDAKNALLELLETNLERAKAEVAEYEESGAIAVPVIMAAMDACGLDTSKSTYEALYVDPANMEQVDATRMQTLRDAVYQAMQWAHKHDPEGR